MPRPTNTLHATSCGLDWPFTPKRREKKLAALAVREVTAYSCVTADLGEVEGLGQLTADQIRVVRLVEHVTFRVLSWKVGGELDPDDAVADVRLACRKLVAGAFG